MGLSPAMHKNMTWDFYQSGHMLYIDSDSRVKLKNDIADFYQRAIPQSLESETPEPGR
jgi:carboxypeptidase C (cathepsin A)